MNLERPKRIESKFGPPGIEGTPVESRLPQIPGVHEMAPGGAGGGAELTWKNIRDKAMSLPEGKAREMMLRQAKNRLEKTMNESDDVGELESLALSWEEIEKTIGGNGVGPVAQNAQAGLESTFYNVNEYEPDRTDRCFMRTSIMSAVDVAESGTRADSVYKVMMDELNQRKKKRSGFYTLPANVEAEMYDEISARLDLHRVSAFWDEMKQDGKPDADVFPAMNSRLRGPTLSDKTERWLERAGRDSSYLNNEGEIVAITDLRNGVSKAAKKIYAEMIKENNQGGLDLWGIKATIRGGERRKQILSVLGLDLNMGTLAWQMAEAELWAAEIPSRNYLHPAARLVDFAGYRLYRYGLKAPVPGGYRLIQEYLDKHGGVLPPKDQKEIRKSIVASEGVQLVRTGLDLWEDTRNVKTGDDRKAYKALMAGDYLKERAKWRAEVVGRENLNDMLMEDLVSGVKLFTDLTENIGGKQATAPVEKLTTIMIDLLVVLKRFYPEDFQTLTKAGGEIETVDLNKARREGEVSKRLLEWAKSLVWGNSVANIQTENALSYFQLADAVTSIIKEINTSDSKDKGVGVYIGAYMKPEDSATKNIEFLKWFEELWKLSDKIIRGDKKLPFYEIRKKIPEGVKKGEGYGYIYGGRLERWIGLIRSKGLVGFKREVN